MSTPSVLAGACEQPSDLANSPTRLVSVRARLDLQGALSVDGHQRRQSCVGPHPDGAATNALDHTAQSSTRSTSSQTNPKCRSLKRDMIGHVVLPRRPVPSPPSGRAQTVERDQHHVLHHLSLAPRWPQQDRAAPSAPTLLALTCTSATCGKRRASTLMGLRRCAHYVPLPELPKIFDSSARADTPLTRWVAYLASSQPSDTTPPSSARTLACIRSRYAQGVKLALLWIRYYSRHLRLWRRMVNAFVICLPVALIAILLVPALQQRAAQAGFSVPLPARWTISGTACTGTSCQATTSATVYVGGFSTPTDMAGQFSLTFAASRPTDVIVTCIDGNRSGMVRVDLTIDREPQVRCVLN